MSRVLSLDRIAAAERLDVSKFCRFFFASGPRRHGGDA